MATTYRVVKPLVIARTAEGRDAYFYQGATIPDGIPQAEIDRLSEGEDPFIVPEDQAEELLANSAGGGQPPAAQAPAKSASKAEWVDYVVANHGVSREDAEKQTRGDLAERYGD